MIDIREFNKGKKVTVRTEEGEEFAGVLVGEEHSRVNEHTNGFHNFTFEGDWWDRVKDRVDMGVLEIHQRFARSTGDPKEPKLVGIVRESEDEPTKTVKIGKIVYIN
jgi:hypothetical protein